MKRNIERFPSKQMYPYLSLVKRKVAEFYHNIDRRSWLVWVRMTYFHRFFRTFPGVLAGSFSFKIAVQFWRDSWRVVLLQLHERGNTVATSPWLILQGESWDCKTSGKSSYYIMTSNTTSRDLSGEELRQWGTKCQRGKPEHKWGWSYDRVLWGPSTHTLWRQSKQFWKRERKRTLGGFSPRNLFRGRGHSSKARESSGDAVWR